MKTKEIRTLSASEIECRIQSIKNNGCILLLYKDARCDMRILDELFGITGWQRSHDLINGNLFCSVEIWDEEKGIWIRKQDVGTESNTEKEKGQASDAFKRACFNIGIGRELYTSPFIYIPFSDEEICNGKIIPSLKFHVSEISYNDKREINNLIICDNKGQIRFKLGEKIEKKDDKSWLNPGTEIWTQAIISCTAGSSLKDGSHKIFTIKDIEKKYRFSKENREKFLDEVAQYEFK